MANSHYTVKNSETIDIDLKYYDIENDTVQISILDQPLKNTALIVENKVLRFKADSDFTGQDNLALLFDDYTNQIQWDMEFEVIETTSHNNGETEVIVLTNNSPDATLSSENLVKVYGILEASHITIENGATVELINFPGENTIRINGNSSLFTVSRFGATCFVFKVMMELTLKIPATSWNQEVCFNDICKELVINNNQVMLGEQAVTLLSAGVEN